MTDEAKPSEVTSRAPLVDLTPDVATPPGRVYIGRDDRLYIRTTSTSSPPTVTLSGRLLHADGVIRPFVFSHVAAANFNAAAESFNLAEGFLLSVAATVETANVQPYQLLVEVGIHRGRFADRQIVQVLFRDWIATQQATGWPGGRIAPPLELPGEPRAAAVPNPAAGSEVSVMLNADAYTRLEALRLELVTDGTAANRQVQLELVAAGGVIWRSPAFDAQTASLTRSYFWAIGGEFQAAPALGDHNGYLPDLILPPASIFRTVTENLQAGDDYGAGSRLVAQWAVQQ